MSDIKTIVSAANFAAIKHKDQRRKDPEGTPYINHPLGVANILTNVSQEFRRCDSIPNFTRNYLANIFTATFTSKYVVLLQKLIKAYIHTCT